MLYHNTFHGNIGPCFPNPECAFLMTNSSSGNQLPWGFYNGVVKYNASSSANNSLRNDIGSCELPNTNQNAGTAASNFRPLLSIMYLGNIGIGNTLPFAPLNIGTPLNTSDASDGNLVISRNNGSSLGRNFKLGYDSSFNFIMGDFGNSNLLNTQINQFIIQNGAYANSLLLKSSGDVDIVPDVSSSLTRRYLNVGGLRLSGWDSNTIYNTGILGISSLSNLTLNTGIDNASLSTRLIIDKSTGNIGIGTTTNSFKLNIDGDLNATSISSNGINLNNKYLSSNLLPSLQKKIGITFTCSTAITLSGTIYYKYDIDLTKYTQNLILSNGSYYRVFSINCYIASGYFNLLSNNLPRVFNYNVYMSNELTVGESGEIAGINICATGTPENFNLDKIPPNYLYLLRTDNYNYLSIVSIQSGISVNCIIIDNLN